MARRKAVRSNDVESVSEELGGGTGAQPGPGLLQLYDRALPEVYGYLLSRCGRPEVAEDLTAETFSPPWTLSAGPSPQP